jgi:hypothetical protein
MRGNVNILVFILIFSALAFAQWDADLYRSAERKYLKNHASHIFRYYENTSIAKDDIIYGNVVVADGNLSVRGEINGDVLVINGDIHVYSNARIDGNITSVGGSISAKPECTITGYQLETSLRNAQRHKEAYYYNFDTNGWQFKHRDKYSTLPLKPVYKKVIFRYNRVQGFFLGLELPKSIGRIGQIVTFHGFGGYGFVEKKWRYQLGLNRYFFSQRQYRFELGGKFYDLTDTRDEWFISPLENTLSSVLFNKDYQDYYRRKGFELHASQNITIYFRGTLYYRNDTYTSLTKNTDWALFGKNKEFRDNPAINEGNMRSVVGELYLDTRNDKDFPFRGWYGKLTMEVSNSRLHSDFYFNQYLLELRRYLPVSRTEQIDIRIRAGSSENNLPLQKYFEIGGIGTMRGFHFKEFVGDRVLLANVEYKLSLPGAKPVSDIKFILFGDVGNAWFTDDNSKFTRGFDHISWGTLKSDVGLGISDWKERIRINMAKRTDTGSKPLVFTLRIAREF